MLPLAASSPTFSALPLVPKLRGRHQAEPVSVLGDISPRRGLVVLCTSTSTRRPSAAEPVVFGFESFKKTFTVDVSRAEGRALDVPLAAPLTIASSRLDGVANVAVRVELRNGSVGWGEAPVLPSVTAEDQHAALAAAADACDLLVRSPPVTLGAALGGVARLLPGHEFASVRAGVEMALIDAAANSIRIPLRMLFGGASDTLTTNITIPDVSPKDAVELASKYREQGFTTLKLKMGENVDSDVEVLKAIRSIYPGCSFILEANEAYKAHQAIQVLDKLREVGITPILFEQPVHRDDWEGLHLVSTTAKYKYNVLVAADESCRSVDDARRIIEGNLAHVINIKLAKLGVLGSLEVIDAARKGGTGLMIGGMVETRLATGFAGHLAAGLGCFSFVDLGTPFFLSDDPVIEGYQVSGAIYKFNYPRGHGGFLHWANIWIEMCSKFDIVILKSLSFQCIVFSIG